MSQSLLDRVLAPLFECLTPEAAQKIVAIRADVETQALVDVPADTASEGQLTDKERAECDGCLPWFHVITIPQAKTLARQLHLAVAALTKVRRTSCPRYAILPEKCPTPLCVLHGSNVFGMRQHADAGLITTKPYLSESSYVLNMSNFRKGPWCVIWDALYWRFIDRHHEFFAGNPQLSVMVAQCDRMGSRLDEHLRVAEPFLAQLHGDS